MTSKRRKLQSIWLQKKSKKKQQREEKRFE